MVEFKINESNYILKFGMGCLIKLGKIWGIGSMSQTMARFAELEKLKDNDIQFEQIEIISDLVHASIVSNSNNKVNPEDIDAIPDALFNDPAKIQEIMEAFVESLPNQTSEKKTIPAKKKK